MGKSRGTTNEPFVKTLQSMLEGHAWRALPDNARRVIDRLQVEHMQHAGTRNGSLVCTFSDFEQYGIRRASVALAVRQAAELGLIEVMKRGELSRADFRAPTLYRLTFVESARGGPTPTHEWRRITTPEAAKVALARAENTPSTSHVTRSKRPKKAALKVVS